MFLLTLLPDLPSCSVEQVSQTEEAIVITTCSTTSSACCPDCQHASSQIHCSYTRCPKALPSSGDQFVCCCGYDDSAVQTRYADEKLRLEPFPHLVAPRAQRTSSVRELLRVIGEAIGGEAGARLSQRLAMKSSLPPYYTWFAKTHSFVGSRTSRRRRDTMPLVVYWQSFLKREM
jgi:hypothetical protein